MKLNREPHHIRQKQGVGDWGVQLPILKNQIETEIKSPV